MKYLKKYENFNKTTYYEFDAIKFYNDFKKIFHNERDNNFRSTDFFKNLDKLVPNWLTVPLDDTVEKLIQDILIKNRKVVFVGLNGDLYDGKVTYVKFFYSVFFKKITYSIILDEKNKFIDVDFTKPVKIYGEPTEIENIVDLYSNTNKYNI
jgi:hypothetical protein